ncbi:MAG: hypothetical protein HRT35_22275 [Algicola sp.]|nr:hypothetical protein [Algicola sp.]
MNLVVNACDAISERRGEMQSQPSFGKPVNTARGKVVVGCRQMIDTIEIYVTDNGNGMSDETQNRLFEPFYTTKGQSKGTGLGLSISYGIMQKHHGELTVSSQLGQGTTFVMHLPTGM